MGPQLKCRCLPLCSHNCAPTVGVLLSTAGWTLEALLRFPSLHCKTSRAATTLFTFRLLTSHNSRKARGKKKTCENIIHCWRQKWEQRDGCIYSPWKLNLFGSPTLTIRKVLRTRRIVKCVPLIIIQTTTGISNNQKGQLCHQKFPGFYQKRKTKERDRNRYITITQKGTN